MTIYLAIWMVYKRAQGPKRRKQRIRKIQIKNEMPVKLNKHDSIRNSLQKNVSMKR